MSRSLLFWILAFLFTAATGVYQRMTGPTYPLNGTIAFGETPVHYHLDRSFAGTSDAPVQLTAEDAGIRGTLLWKKHGTEDAWTEVPMERTNGLLKASLPGQAPLAKLDYQFRVEKKEATLLVPARPVTVRFKGEVPLWVLVPHVLAMFAAMLFSLRAGLEYFSREPAYTKLTYWTIGLLLVGGFIFGPLMSYYAFDLLWTGWPVGGDLTDNKTAIALVGWVAAAIGMKRSKNPGAWIVAAAAVMFAIFLIPHSI